jgi:predicted GNAT family N-acyltransferase
MITSAFIPGNQDTSDPFLVRDEVFVEEQNCPRDKEYDGFDPQALHLIIYVEEEPAVTGRIWYEDDCFRIGRLGVRKQYRGQKLGDLALRLLLFKTFSMGANKVEIHTQSYLAKFYEKFGFKAQGEQFIESDIPHIAMSVSKDDVVYPSDCSSDE